MQLLDADPGFRDDYVEARGYSNDALWNAAAKQAIDDGNVRMLEFLIRVRTPEGQALNRQRIDAHIDVEMLVASAEWIGLRDKILEALRPFPDALAAVVAALGGGGEERRELTA